MSHSDGGMKWKIKKGPASLISRFPGEHTWVWLLDDSSSRAIEVKVVESSGDNPAHITEALGSEGRSVVERFLDWPWPPTHIEVAPGSVTKTRGGQAPDPLQPAGDRPD